MYRISDELAKEIILKIKTPEFDSVGNTAFLPKSPNSVGLIDPICCLGTMFHYLLESPRPIIFPGLPYNPAGINGYFLYRREELKPLNEPWEINRMLVDMTCNNPEEKLDVRDAAVVLPSDIEKLTAQTITTMEKLIEKEPLIIDCLDLEKKHG